MSNNHSISTAAEALSNSLDNNEEYRMKVQALMQQAEAQNELLETCHRPRSVRILRAIFRPVLHIGIEILSISTQVLTMILCMCAALGFAVMMTGYVMNITHMSNDSTQAIVLTLAIAGTTIYTFVKAMLRSEKWLRAMTNEFHARVQ